MASIAQPTFMVEVTITGPHTLGRISRNRILKSLLPRTLATLESARAAKISIRGRISEVSEISGIAIERLSDGFGLKVNLRRQPTTMDDLPKSYKGVPIRYEVVGVIRALSVRHERTSLWPGGSSGRPDAL